MQPPPQINIDIDNDTDIHHYHYWSYTTPIFKDSSQSVHPDIIYMNSARKLKISFHKTHEGHFTKAQMSGIELSVHEILIKTNTLIIENNPILRFLADNCAKLWNKLNYKRRQAYTCTFNRLSNSIANHKENNEAWKSFLTLKKLQKENLTGEILILYLGISINSK